MDEKGLGRLLQVARQKSGYTQQALCQKAGLSYSTLTKIERGAIKAPSIFTIQVIAHALDTSLDALMGDVVPTAPKKRTRSGASFIYFDMNGCLVRYYDRAFAHIAEVSGAPYDVIETTFWHYNDQANRGHMTMQDFNQSFAHALGIEHLDWLEEYLAAIEPIKPMQELVQWAAANYRVGLLTNTMPGFVEVMRKKHLLPNVGYAAIVDSSKEKIIKPEAEIYTIAAQKAGCSPDEILLIDDTRINLMAAEQQGWHVLLFNDYRLEESMKRIKDALIPVDAQ